MTKNNCTTTKNTFKHLTDIQRGRLEEMEKSGNLTQIEMATELGVSQSTVSRVIIPAKWHLIECITIAIWLMQVHVSIKKTDDFARHKTSKSTLSIF